jgi:hypothetical protein
MDHNIKQWQLQSAKETLIRTFTDLSMKCIDKNGILHFYDLIGMNEVFIIDNICTQFKCRFRLRGEKNKILILITNY